MVVISETEYLYLYVLYSMENKKSELFSKYASDYYLDKVAIEMVEDKIKKGYNPSEEQIKSAIDVMLKEQVISRIQ